MSLNLHTEFYGLLCRTVRRTNVMTYLCQQATRKQQCLPWLVSSALQGGQPRHSTERSSEDPIRTSKLYGQVVLCNESIQQDNTKCWCCHTSSPSWCLFQSQNQSKTCPSFILIDCSAHPLNQPDPKMKGPISRFARSYNDLKGFYKWPTGDENMHKLQMTEKATKKVTPNALEVPPYCKPA